MAASKKSTDLTLALPPSQVAQVVSHFSGMRKKRSLFIWGPPGISKSSVIAQEAKARGMEFIDIRLSQMDPTDLRGIPFPTTETAADGSTYSGMRWSAPTVLPRDPNARAIILLDEFNSAPPSVQAGAYQLILDRKLGEYTVPEGCVIIAAGNRENDKGITFRMPSPIANRFVHIEMRHDFDDWQRWALNAQVDKSVVGYVTAFKQDLFQFEAGSASRGFATPRTWEFVSDLLEGAEALPDEVLMGLVVGAVGEGIGIKFVEYRRLADDLPAPRDILSGAVKTLNKPEIALCYALTTALCYELKDGSDAVAAGKLEKDKWLAQADNFLGFMMANFTPEVTIMGAKTALSVFKLKFQANKMSNFGAFTAKFKDLIMG